MLTGQLDSRPRDCVLAPCGCMEAPQQLSGGFDQVAVNCYTFT
jgi:hypothetical protein